MPTRSGPSPLAGAALALVGSGATPAELVARLADNKATIDDATARDRLDELSDLGLLRAVSSSTDTRYYVTPLGERLLEASFAVNAPEADMLAEVEQMRTELLSTIAHELRTPLTAVRTSVGLLLDPAVVPTKDEHRSLLVAIDRNATRMQRVVGDILDLARFRAGRVQLQLRRFEALELAMSAIASVRPLSDSRSQRIDVVAPAEPVRVFGDFRRLEQALVNLLSNAQKYSPDGAPITVSIVEAGGEIKWSVTDRGQGIRSEDRARLFERFFVAGRDRREAQGGVGLGLPITLLIAQAHGGRVDVRSRPGRGSTFTLAVPVDGPERGPDQ